MQLTPRRPALLLLPAAVAAVSNACTYQIGNRFFDLSPLARADHDYTARLNGFTYHFNLCAPTMKMCNGQLAPASKWRGAGEGKCNNLGHVDTQIATFVDDKHPGRGVRLSWSGGDSCKKEIDGRMRPSTRQVTFDIMCDHEQKQPILRSVEEINMCSYKVVFASDHGCLSDHSSVGASTLLRYLVVAALLYLALGYAYISRTHHLSGVEALPHIELWREVPGLIDDGFAFSVAQLKALTEWARPRGAGEPTAGAVGDGGYASDNP